MGDWQDISSAPKDGAPFLARVVGRGDIGSIIVARRKPGWNSWLSIPGDYQCHPTHWMPLPVPPVAP
jgi:hypothetical protein